MPMDGEGEDQIINQEEDVLIQQEEEARLEEGEERQNENEVHDQGGERRLRRHRNPPQWHLDYDMGTGEDD